MLLGEIHLACKIWHVVDIYKLDIYNPWLLLFVKISNKLSTDNGFFKITSTSQHESKTSQQKSKTSQHEPNTSQHESTQVKKCPRWVNMS